jgi:long-chain acyl-CoA synthetase
MAMEFFEPHFFPGRHRWRRRLTNSLNYYLAALLFGGFPLPRREAGARQAVRYMGELADDGFSVLIFPEGSRSETGRIQPFRAGVGMIASRLQLPVVPVRLEGLERVLRRGWKLPRRGPVRVAFGPPLRLMGEDYASLAARVEQAVRGL